MSSHCSRFPQPSETVPKDEPCNTVRKGMTWRWPKYRLLWSTTKEELKLCHLQTSPKEQSKRRLLQWRNTLPTNCLHGRGWRNLYNWSCCRIFGDGSFHGSCCRWWKCTGIFHCARTVLWWRWCRVHRQYVDRSCYNHRHHQKHPDLQFQRILKGEFWGIRLKSTRFLMIVIHWINLDQADGFPGGEDFLHAASIGSTRLHWYRPAEAQPLMWVFLFYFSMFVMSGVWPPNLYHSTGAKSYGYIVCIAYYNEPEFYGLSCSIC